MPSSTPDVTVGLAPATPTKPRIYAVRDSKGVVWYVEYVCLCWQAPYAHAGADWFYTWRGALAFLGDLYKRDEIAPGRSRRRSRRSRHADQAPHHPPAGSLTEPPC